MEMIKWISTIMLLGSIFDVTGYAQSTDKECIRHILTDHDGKPNTLYSIYWYDSAGNQFQVMQEFDHKPSVQDSIIFSKSVPDQIHEMMANYYLEERFRNALLDRAYKSNKTKRKKKS